MARDKTAETFSLLLQAFSANEAEAVAFYTDLYKSLVRFFRLKGDVFPEEAADKTIDRITLKLTQGENINDMKKYAFTIARLVFFERLRQAEKEKNAAAAFYQQNGNQTEAGKIDPVENFRECLAALSDEEKALLKSYFADMPFHELSLHREKMSREMGVSVNGLRMTIYRLRGRLENCVKKKNEEN